MGTTGGGLWKTDDLGLNWSNVSDGYFKTGSVGAIAVPESDANVVYVGMGEHAVRGVMTHHGDGVYKSTDAGKPWKQMGLEATQHIARIVVHPPLAHLFRRITYCRFNQPDCVRFSQKETAFQKLIDGTARRMPQHAFNH